MKTIQSYLKAFAFCFSFCILQCACSRDGGLIHVVPNNVKLSGDSQSFTVTTKEREPYFIYLITIGDTRYDKYGDDFMKKYDIQGTCNLDVEWIHWQHSAGDVFSTVSVDENQSGIVREARIYIGSTDCSGILSITQLSKE